MRDLDLDIRDIVSIRLRLRSDDTTPADRHIVGRIQLAQRERNASVERHARSMAGDVIRQLAEHAGRQVIDADEIDHLTAKLSGLGIRALNTLWSLTHR